jgi:hypothetical protein
MLRTGLLEAGIGTGCSETGEWRRLHNEELHELYSSTIFIRLMKSIRMRWAGNVARVEN